MRVLHHYLLWAQEWDREWQLLVNSADLQRQTPTSSATGGQLPYDFLEQFHVFVLANILRRPIVIVGEPYLRSVTGDCIEPNDFVGIYLPLLWHPYSCLRMPIVLAFLMDHILPLACCNLASGRNKSSKAWAVPLVTSSLEPLRIHFLLPHEENIAYTLQQLYLHLTELQDEGGNLVLAARILSDNFTRSSSMTVRNLIFESDDFLPRCSTENCEFPLFGRISAVCLACLLNCPPYQSLVDDSLKSLLGN